MDVACRLGGSFRASVNYCAMAQVTLRVHLINDGVWLECGKDASLELNQETLVIDNVTFEMMRTGTSFIAILFLVAERIPLVVCLKIGD
ncbi:hypothetical protein MUK42_17898 [Musa troglodytarum]|uniref:Uncharacterized protein n=1 Tax=Musa troglodytarum TaxID=320322 RepID=A0A9E7H9Q7_9LILI|nr:hypothetical protein MUK42_17898 [Musa troglodytarum]